MFNRRKFYAVIITGLCVIITGCGKKEEPPKVLRSIKTMKIAELATSQVRNFSGIVYAVNYSFLSFEDVSGRLIELNVDIGDEVKKGQILAVLDKQKYQLDVKNAQAQLKKAEANFIKAKSDYDREIVLFEKGASFQQRLDTRKYQFEAAKSGVGSAKAALGLAKRNLKNTVLESPYNGFVGKRYVQSNQEIKVGEKIFRIDQKGDMEVQFNIPESLRPRVSLKMKGDIKLLDERNKEFKCEVSYLGTAASEGNAFPAKALILDASDKDVKPGMTAEVILALPVKNKHSKGFLLPPSAILWARGRGEGYVFVYNPEKSIVKKTKVKCDGAQENKIIVVSGLKEGDIIATAGLAFLLDDMEVNLYKPSVENGAE